MTWLCSISAALLLATTTPLGAPSNVDGSQRIFSPRIVHSGHGVGEYSDEHLDEIARSGMDAIVVYLADAPDLTRTGRWNLSSYARRVKRHGLDVYLYIDRWKKPFPLNPNDSGAERYYDEFFGSIVRAAPELKGMVLVGESVPFPSHDAGIAGYGWEPRDPNTKTKGVNGFWPVSEWATLLEIATRATRRYNSDFDILFWTYSWAGAPEADRLALLEHIPTNVTLQVTFELGDTNVVRNGVSSRVDDYSITVPGPSAVFRSEAAVAKRRGIRLAAMSCTGGRTWDYGGVPFVPVPALWKERFRNLRRAREEYGLSGLMESHAFGFTPNPIAEMAQVAFTAGTTERDVDAALVRYATRVFGDAADAALAAMREWSEGFRYHSSSALDQYGVLRLGPTYPLVFYGEKVPPPPADYCAANKRPGRWAYLFDTAGFGEMDRADTLRALDWAEREEAAWHRGNARLAAVFKNTTSNLSSCACCPPDPKKTTSVQQQERDAQTCCKEVAPPILLSYACCPPDPKAAQLLLDIGLYCEATARTLKNLKRYQLLGPNGDPKELNPIIDDEIANVQSLLPIVERNPAIGFEPNMRRINSPALLRWKMRTLADAWDVLTRKK